MFEALQSRIREVQGRVRDAVAPAVMERAALLLNHVVAAEPAAVERLKPHAGRRLEVELAGWPAWLAAPPPAAFLVTPAGLLEWCGMERGAGADLVLRLDVSEPAQLASRTLGGELPPVAVEGDAQFAGDVNWLIQNLRWDIESDLEALFGPAVAPLLARAGRGLAAGLKQAAQTAGRIAERVRPRS